jgi:hypothetical protein
MILVWHGRRRLQPWRQMGAPRARIPPPSRSNRCVFARKWGVLPRFRRIKDGAILAAASRGDGPRPETQTGSGEDCAANARSAHHLGFSWRDCLSSLHHRESVPLFGRTNPKFNATRFAPSRSRSAAKLAVQGLYPAVMCGADCAALVRKQYDEYPRFMCRIGLCEFGISGVPANIDAEISAFGPSQLAQFLDEGCQE